MLTSNHTSQNATSPAYMLWANNEGMLASTFNCFFGIRSKHLLLSSSWRPASLGFALLESRRSVLLSGGSRKKTSHPFRRRHGWQRNLKKNQARSWSNWWFHCTHLETTLVQRQHSLSDRRDRGMFDRLRKGGPFWKIWFWNDGLLGFVFDAWKKQRGLMALHHGINLKITN